MGRGLLPLSGLPTCFFVCSQQLAGLENREIPACLGEVWGVLVVRHVGTQKTVTGHLWESPELGSKFSFYSSRQWENRVLYVKLLFIGCILEHIYSLRVA